MKYIKSIFTNRDNYPRLILFFALLLRLAFHLVNYDANDNHWEFAFLINIAPVFPPFNYCHECFQPPVFYWIVAKVGKILNYYSLEQIRFIMQTFSTIAGFFLCFIIYRWHNLLNIPTRYKNISLAFWLFNSSLLALNCSATNDTLLIALASGSVLYFYLYVLNGHFSHLVISVFLAVLCPVIKGSGLAILPFVVWIIIIFNYRNNFNFRKIAFSIIALVLLGVFIDWAGGYAHKRNTHGDAFVINSEKPIKAEWNTNQGYIKRRYGIMNIKSGYFHFPFFSLIEMPYNINDGNDYPNHRTNFWTQMYGQFFSVQFLSHPSTWNHHHPDYYNITRGVFIAGLLILYVFIAGFFFTFRQAIIRIKESFFKPDLYVFSLVVFLLFLVLNITYSLQYRDFSFIKMAYFFPAVLGFIGIFGKGLEFILKNRFLKKPMLYILVGIIIYYFFDYFMLFKKCLEDVPTS